MIRKGAPSSGAMPHAFFRVCTPSFAKCDLGVRRLPIAIQRWSSRLPGDNENEDLADISHAIRSGIIGCHRVERAKIWRRLSGICEKVRRLGQIDHHYVEQNSWQELRESAAPVAYESRITARAGN
jgi:hypothetical protein